MKTLLLIITCLMGIKVNAETKTDSIIVNVGAKKKVVIYGETKADLKELEKIDLNKALLEMNKGLGEMPLKTKKMVVKDYDGGTYRLDTSEIHLTPWNRFVKKTNISVHAAAVNLGYYSIKPNEFPNSYSASELFVAESFGGIRNSINFGISLMHRQQAYKINNQWIFALKKGLRYDFYRIDGGLYTPFTIIKPTIVYTKILYNPSIYTFGFLSAELQPTFYLANKKGISISPGFFCGVKIPPIRKSNNYTNFIYLDNEAKWYKNSLQPFGNIHAGVNLEASYKVFHLFWRQNLYSNSGLILGTTKDFLPLNYIKSANGRIRITTFGLRIGR